MKRNQNETRLRYWQDWMGRNDSAYSFENMKMDEREELYRGEKRDIEPLTKLDKVGPGKLRKAVHVRNIIAENIESCVSSAIPQPKVTARRREDEEKARLIENMLRNELDRLPMELLNDMAERTIPIQGGAYWLVDWDDTARSHGNVGEVTVKLLHPKEVTPQDGVYTAVEDMDAIVLKLPQTKSWVKRQYGVDVDEENEEEADVRTLDADASTAEDLVTVYIAYYKGDNGEVGRFCWCGESVLEDVEDYRTRQVRRCEACGEICAADEVECPACGNRKIKTEKLEEEKIWLEVKTAAGNVIPGAAEIMDAAGMVTLEPTKVPYYRVDSLPIFLQKNISVYGKLLGDSDVDKIRDQQNTINRMETKIIDRLVKAGTRITLPDRADFKVDPEDQERWYVGSAADKQLIDVYDFSGNLQYEMAYMTQAYEEARQILGITDSFQGRNDTTAKSGVAKQFAAAQSAGRLESKRVLKEAAYAELFKRIFQLKLAYCDEPRPVVSIDDRGDPEYGEFNRYDFLERDENGNWYWNDDFLFSCDTSAPLASNREQLWQDTTASLQSGAFGDPTQIETLIFYWSKMELLHYPGAADTKQAMERRLQEQQAQMMQQAQAQQQAMQMAGTQAENAAMQAAQQAAERDIMRQVEDEARQAAMRDAGMR